MYAQWESAEHYQAMRSNPVASPFLDQALAIANFDPGMYEVVKVFSARFRADGRRFDDGAMPRPVDSSRQLLAAVG